jgi:methionyl-tRNA formyltransferase
MNLALFISGGIGFKVFKHLMRSNHVVVCVFTDSNSSEIITYAYKKKIPLFVGNPRNDRALKFMDVFLVNLILSVNYLFIIERSLFSKSNLAVNIHGSLLPKYRGRTPHVWAIINNEKKTGITAHLIDDGCDTGDIIRQMEVQIGEYYTGADILEKFKQLYPKMVDSILADLESESLTFTSQNHENATFFGKRTPDDGQINWNWQKERIRNWVRAQAKPYPGAFTFLNDQKIIIDEIDFNNLGFDATDQNGQIISLNPTCVKTPNGVVELKKIRNLEMLSSLEVGQKFV